MEQQQRAVGWRIGRSWGAHRALLHKPIAEELLLLYGLRVSRTRNMRGGAL